MRCSSKSWKFGRALGLRCKNINYIIMLGQIRLTQWRFRLSARLRFWSMHVRSSHNVHHPLPLLQLHETRPDPTNTYFTLSVPWMLFFPPSHKQRVAQLGRGNMPNMMMRFIRDCIAHSLIYANEQTILQWLICVLVSEHKIKILIIVTVFSLLLQKESCGFYFFYFIFVLLVILY